MTIPAPDYLEYDEWFGHPVLSLKQEKKRKIKTLAKAKETTPIHIKMYELSTKTLTTRKMDPSPWMSGAGM